MLAMGVAAIPILLALIDLYFVILGYWWTISNCKLAARAASQGPPNMLLKDSATNRAKNVLSSNVGTSGATVHIVSCDVTEKVKGLPDSIIGGPVAGTVTVNIQVEVVPPFMLKLTVPGQKFVVDSSQTCPYTWILQPTPPDAPKSNYVTTEREPSNYVRSK